MLFNSHLFLFVFLPVTLLGYYLIGKSKYSRMTIIWLVAASLLFYGLYNPVYVVLIACSILLNYTAGSMLVNKKLMSYRKLVMVTGVVANILLLGYFKYANFFVDNTNAIFNSDFHLTTIVLPLAISFFTLQQIAYVVDTYRREVSTHNFIDYCLFVIFFPKLISGPIVRFNEIMPQIVKNHLYRQNTENIAIGLTILFLGLFKKVVLADSLGEFADPVFDTASRGIAVSFFYSWSGALTYTLQLYFDFSGYTDMAIGLGLMFGIRLPLNFYSPYKATSIIDFWRRWHMTLSSFLRDYIYIPLGGNRRGFPRQMVNLLVVMLIAGLWHGAGWTFVVWGALHGLYLAINRVWRRLKKERRQVSNRSALSVLFTFILVTIAWVFFRADSLTAAITILKGMVGMSGFVLTPGFQTGLGVFGQFLGQIGITFKQLGGFSYQTILWIMASLVICWFLPNAQEYMSNYQPSLDSFTREPETIKHQWLRWAPSIRGTIIISVITVWAFLALTQVTTFIYAQF